MPSSTPPIIFLLGVSGAGKGTLRNNIAAGLADRITIVPSYVTRPMREGESQGNPYHFISREAFEQALADDTILEHNVYADNYYGTSLHLLRDVQQTNKIPLKELDTNGLIMLKEQQKIPGEYITVFLSLDEQTARARLTQRGDTTNIDERIALQIDEKAVADKHCDYIIDTTGTPDDVYNAFVRIIDEIYPQP